MGWFFLRGLSSPSAFLPSPKRPCGGLASPHLGRERLGFLVLGVEQRMTPEERWFQTYENQREGLAAFGAWDKYSRASQRRAYLGI